MYFIHYCQSHLVLSFLSEAPQKPAGPIIFSDVTADSVKLSWQPSSDEGSSPVTKYNIEYKDTRQTSWTKAGSVDKDTTVWTQNKLLEDSEYVFRVTAINAEGESEPLESKDTVKPKKPLGRLHIIRYLDRQIQEVVQGPD